MNAQFRILSLNIFLVEKKEEEFVINSVFIRQCYMTKQIYRFLTFFKEWIKVLILLKDFEQIYELLK